jgi:hypothetical protein
MNTLKTTMSKIAQIEQPKTELAKHEVELASINELKTIIAETKKSFDNLEKIGDVLFQELTKAEKTKRGFESALLSAKSLVLNSGNEQIKLFQAKAKELGLDVSNVAEIKEIIKLQNEAKGYDDFYKGIGKIPLATS